MKKVTFFVLLLTFLGTFSMCAENPDVIKANNNYLIILVHGCPGDHTAFDGDYNIKHYLTNDLGLDGYVYAYDFSDNRQSNDDNAKELGERGHYYKDKNDSHSYDKCWIERAEADYAANKNYSSWEAIPQNLRPSKIILIAHSMGGLGCRAYLTSSYYQDDVKKLVTLDVPHLGADGVAFYNKYWLKMLKEINYWGVDFSDKNIDQWIQDNIITNIQNSFNDQVAKSGASSLGNSVNYLLSIPRWPDIEKDSAHWVVDLEMPNNELKAQLDGLGWDKLKWSLENLRIVPVVLDSFAYSAVLLGMSGQGLDEVDPDGSWIKNLANKTPKSGSSPISYRLVSALGNPTPDKDYIDSIACLATPTISYDLLPYTSDWNALPNESAKYWSLVESVALPGIWSVKNGSILVAEDSSRGEGVKMFDQNTKRYSYYFHNDKFEDNIKGCQDLYYILLGLAIIPPYLVNMQTVHDLPMWILTALSIGTTADDLVSQGQEGVIANHPHITSAVCNSQTDGPPIIDLALFDTPMATVTHLDTDVDTGEYNTSQKIVHTGIVQPVEILNTSEASDSPPYAADRSVSLIFNEGTTSEVEKYTSDMLVKVPVTQISGVIHDFKPLMLSSFQISENFAAWQEFAPNAQAQKTDSQGFKYIDVDANKFHLHMDEWGRYTISGLNFAEGQNLVAFKLCNRAQYSSNQVLKVIQNSIIESQLAFNRTIPSVQTA